MYCDNNSNSISDNCVINENNNCSNFSNSNNGCSNNHTSNFRFSNYLPIIIVIVILFFYNKNEY